MASRTTCTNVSLGTGRDGLPYCHVCRDWKSDRIAHSDRRTKAIAALVAGMTTEDIEAWVQLRASQRGSLS